METAARGVLVAIIATFCSAAPMIVLLAWDMDSQPRVSFAGGLMLLALVGNLLIGLPISLIAFSYLRQKDRLSIAGLLILANLVAAVLVLALAGTGGAFAAIFYGIPTFIAANAFAIFGWLIVIKPARARA